MVARSLAGRGDGSDAVLAGMAAHGIALSVRVRPDANSIGSSPSQVAALGKHRLSGTGWAGHRRGVNAPAVGSDLCRVASSGSPDHVLP